MITNNLTLRINRTDAERAMLRDEESRRRQLRRQEREATLKEATKPTAPLSIAVEAEAARRKAISVEVLIHLDAFYQSAEALARVSPLDAAPLAKAALSVALRLSWVRLSGKELTAPEPGEVPHKMWLRQAVTKPVLRRLHHAANKLPTSAASASELLECSRALIIWLASDEGTVMS